MCFPWLNLSYYLCHAGSRNVSGRDDTARDAGSERATSIHQGYPAMVVTCHFRSQGDISHTVSGNTS